MAEIDVIIDEPTNSVVHRPTGEVFATRIVPWKDLSAEQLAALSSWHFDWRREANTAPREVVALLVPPFDAIQGLISFEPRKGHVFVHLVENAPYNVGHNQLYQGVASNLFAFTCLRSSDFGFNGFIAFDSKTDLIDHYKRALGAEQVGSSHRMYLDGAVAARLIARHYREGEDQWS